MVESLVGATIFVDNRGPMPQSQQSSDGYTILSSQLDLQAIAHVLGQIPKPGSRLGKKPLAPSGHQKKAIEFVDQLIGTAHLSGKSFPLRPPNPSLDRILMQLAEYFLQRGRQIQCVQVVGVADSKARRYTRTPGHWP
jgi:hypothetical protein